MPTTAYDVLPFPLCNLSAPDEPVTLVDLRDTALPLLRSAHCTLRALSLAVARDQVALDDLAPALAVLAGQVEMCRDLLDRASVDV
jgi:hypothetical protein